MVTRASARIASAIAFGVIALASVECASAQSTGVTLDYLNALVDFPANRGALSLSPDGAHVAFLTRTRDEARDVYVHRLHVLDLTPPYRARMIGEAGDIILSFENGRSSGVGIERAPLWSPAGDWIAYIAERDGRAELWRIRPNGRSASRVAGAEADVRRFRWSEDGRSLIVREQAPRAEIYRRLSDSAHLGFNADRLFAPIFSLGPQIDKDAGGSIRAIAMRTLQGAPSDEAALAPPRRQGAWIAPRAGQTATFRPALGLFVEHQGAEILCELPGCEGQLVDAWRLADGRVVFLRQTGHNGVLTEIAIWSRVNDQVSRLRQQEDRLRHCVQGGPSLICVADAPLHPQHLIRIDLATGEERTIFEPNSSWESQLLPRVERLDVTNADGLASFAHLVYPLDYVAGRRYPLVIVQYRSRGFLRAGVGGEYPILPLAGRGYFVLSVERPEDHVRATDAGAQDLLLQQELDGTERGMKLEALQRLVAMLEERALIDISRVAITGMSDGAETLYHAIRHWPIFAAAVSSSPPTDAASWWLNSRRFRELRGAGGLSAPWTDPPTPWNAWWRDASAANHAGDIGAPLLLNMPESEVLLAMPLVARLQESQFPHDLYVYPGAYHNKWRPRQIRASQDRAIAWIDLWLRDIDTAAPDEPERAARWRTMRDAWVAQHTPRSP